MMLKGILCLHAEQLIQKTIKKPAHFFTMLTITVGAHASLIPEQCHAEDA